MSMECLDNDNYENSIATITIYINLYCTYHLKCLIWIVCICFIIMCIFVLQSMVLTFHLRLTQYNLFKPGKEITIRIVLNEYFVIIFKSFRSKLRKFWRNVYLVLNDQSCSYNYKSYHNNYPCATNYKHVSLLTS